MKIRLDQLLVDQGLAADSKTAAALIGAGEVYVNDTIADKAGHLYPVETSVRLKARCPYVSRAGLKLAKGLTAFAIDVADYCCLDIGASTGGFTDCLLQNGARQVFAVDVGYGQLDWKLRTNPQVVLLERTNARSLTPEKFNEVRFDLAVIDVSFISLSKIIPVLVPLFDTKISIIALIKPQFELNKDDVAAGGVVRSQALHEKAIAKVTGYLNEAALNYSEAVISPIQGQKGNTEFLIHIYS